MKLLREVKIKNKSDWSGETIPSEVKKKLIVLFASDILTMIRFLYSFFPTVRTFWQFMIRRHLTLLHFYDSRSTSDNAANACAHILQQGAQAHAHQGRFWIFNLNGWKRKMKFIFGSEFQFIHLGLRARHTAKDTVSMAIISEWHNKRMQITMYFKVIVCTLKCNAKWAKNWSSGCPFWYQVKHYIFFFL